MRKVGKKTIDVYFIQGGTITEVPAKQQSRKIRGQVKIQGEKILRFHLR